MEDDLGASKGDTLKDTFRNIKAGISRVKFPFTDPNAVAFVRSLLEHSPARRLGIGGAAQVRQEKFLAGIDFDQLRRGEVAAPFVPNLASSADASFFHTEDQTPPPFEPYEDDGSNWDAVF